MDELPLQPSFDNMDEMNVNTDVDDIFSRLSKAAERCLSNKQRIPSQDDANLMVGANIHVRNVLHITIPFTVRRTAHKTN